MTDADIYREYEALFDSAYRSQHGPDVGVIIETLAKMHNMDPAEVLEVVMEHAVQGPC